MKLALEPLKDRMSVIRSIGNVSVESKFEVGEICKRISNEPVESDHMDQKQKLPLSDHFNLVPFQGPLRKTNNIFTGILTLRLVAVVCQASRKGQKLNALESVIQVLEGLGLAKPTFPCSGMFTAGLSPCEHRPGRWRWGHLQIWRGLNYGSHKGGGHLSLPPTMRTMHCSPILALLSGIPGAWNIKEILNSLLLLWRLSQEGRSGRV